MNDDENASGPIRRRPAQNRFTPTRTPTVEHAPPPVPAKVVSPLAGMGRLAQWDERNKQHLMPKAAPELRRRFWHGGEVLDQGDTPQCVGYAGWQWLASGPVVNHPKFTPTTLYEWAQQEDEWPGEDYEGSSTLGLMKAFKKRGYVGEYLWAFKSRPVVNWVLEHGPVLMGTNWYMDMFTPDEKGFIEPAGDAAGGHEWVIIGVDLDEPCYDGSVGAVRMINSWGRGWGDAGRAWVSIQDLDRLIREDGEAVTATEIRVPIAKVRA